VTIVFQSIEGQQPGVPRALDFEVPRARLLERLRHQNARVKVLAAPSGYGKTTLVAQAVRELKSEVVWLQVVPDDADVFHFVQSLHAAIFQSRWQDSELATLLATNPSTGALGAALKRVLFNSEPLELVLDNAEHLSQETRVFLSDILEADLGLTKVWVIGFDLEHLRLARLVGRGAAVILTQDDMRFDATETQHVLEAHQSSENPDEVFTKLDGWCAGVGLIAVGVSPHITPTNLIFDAISQLPSKLRDALPEAAVLEIWNETTAKNLGCELPTGWLAEVRRK
jgi:LuxR family transcriptional regulator, maltose regulon positive regulatory protein